MEIHTNWSQVNKQFRSAVQWTVQHVRDESASRGIRGAAELRNSALRVLRGQRSGHRYPVPHTKRRYTASAPGEPPAVRTGLLRQSWSLWASGGADGAVMAGIHTGVPYAPHLEHGTGRMAARPYAHRILEDAQPRVREIFRRPWLR